MPFSRLKGRKLALIDTLYTRGSKLTDWKDHLTVVYKDLVTGKKDKIEISEPTIDLYIVKEEFRTFKSARHYIEKEKCDVKTVKYRNVLYEIAKIAGGSYLEYYKTHNMKERRNLYKYPYVLGGDVNIETYYRVLWREQVGLPETVPLTKAALDIEVDQIDFKGNIARHGECPINAVTVIDVDTKISYTFLLNTHNNPQIDDFIQHQPEFQQYLHELFDESYPGMTYQIYMFDDELEMIRQLFNLIHSLKKDFIQIWNMGFDIPYIRDRLEIIGTDPRRIMCSQDFEVPVLYYSEDTRTFEWANKKDYFDLSDYTHYIDQLIGYAALRKSQGTVKKVNLGAVAKAVLKDEKLNYSDEGNIRTLPYENYKMFVAYNIKDVLLQMGIELKEHDLDNLYNITTVNFVPYKNAYKQTIVFEALLYYHLRNTCNMIMGHNVNFDSYTEGKYDENGERIYWGEEEEDEEDADSSFEGAINGNTLLNACNGKMLYGKPSKFLLGLTIDFDFSSMYPSSIIAFNIFAATMIGKIIIQFTPEKTYDIDMGKEYIEDVIGQNLLHLGHKWHNLSTVAELNDKMKAKLEAKRRKVA